MRVRELELRRLAAELSRAQPRGTVDRRSASEDLGRSAASSMIVQVTGADDRNALLDFVEERISPRLAAVQGVSRKCLSAAARRAR